MTEGSVGVLTLHYSADPTKRPGTPAGDDWLEKATQGYPGGVRSPRWRKEMEIDWGALGGTRVFPDLEEWLAHGQIIIHPFDPVGYKLYGSYDHGWRNPSSFHVHGIDRDGNMVTLWEFYASRVPVPQIAKILNGQDVLLGDGRQFHGCPYWDKLVWRVADPSIWAQDQVMADNTNKSIADLFRRYGVYFTRGERGGDTMVAEWLHGHYWLNPTQPLYRITTDCPKLIWELSQQRHQDYSAKVALTKDQPEKLIDKDNHAWDDLKMFLQRFPPRPIPRPAPVDPNTFNWWKEQAKRAKMGLRPSSYRRGMIGDGEAEARPRK